MCMDWIAVCLVLVTQDPELELVSEPLAEGGKVEYEVRTEADGSKTRHGDFTVYDSDGKKVVLGKYDSGLKSGRWNYRYADGKPWVTGAYKEGRRNGKWTFRHPNREKRAEGSYFDGSMKGKWEFSNDEGELQPGHTGTYAPIVSYYRGSVLEYRGATLDDRLHGRWELYWENGVKMLEAEYARGSRVGNWRFWHSDGTYDPRMLSAQFGDGHEFAQLYSEPIPVEDGDANSAIREAASSVASRGPQPSRMLPLDPGVLDIDLVAALRSADHSEHAKATAAVFDLGREALPGVLEALRHLDYEQAADVALAQRILVEVVQPIFHGHGLLQAEEPPNQEAVRLAVLRVHSLYVLTRKSTVWWDLELQALEHPRSESSCTLLFSPPVESEVLYGSVGGGPYAGRFLNRGKLREAGISGTTETLEKALEWLAENQRPDGSWASGNGLHDIGVTGLALLALLGDGNTLDRGEHQDSIVRGVRWLVSFQNLENGLIFKKALITDSKSGAKSERWSLHYHYDHAIATQVLCELAALSGSHGIREMAQKAVNYITHARNPYGVWRYDSPPVGDNDTSISGWMITALIAAKRANLNVDEKSFKDAITWFDEVTDNATGRVGYSVIGEPSQRYSDYNPQYPREKTEAMTAAGLWCRLLIGQDPETTPILKKHADLLRRVLPYWKSSGTSVDLYYWYYGTYAMNAMGGAYWAAWNKSLKSALVDNAQDVAGADAGSWEPIGAWGMPGGRAYATAMSALCLEVYFRFEAQGE